MGEIMRSVFPGLRSHHLVDWPEFRLVFQPFKYLLPVLPHFPGIPQSRPLA
jgi:hypothetical protein